MEIDWSKAPEGATHYQPHQGAYYRHSPYRGWLVWASEHPMGEPRWHQARGTDEKQLIARRAAWDGTGLPPVGAKVILSDANHDVFEPYKEMIGVEVAVVASFASPAGFDMIACALPDGLCGCFRADMARPIRTPEQIAAEEREKAVDEMMAVHEHWIATRRFCEKLYDAGYRKQA